MKYIFMISFLSLLVSNCGVKGRPLPPETPSEMGIGRPVFKGVDNELNGASSPEQRKVNNAEDEEALRKKRKGEK